MDFDLEEKVRQKKSSIPRTRSMRSAIFRARKKNLVPVIAEIKRKSPSRGVIKEQDLVQAGRQMQKGGACGLSVLTDVSFDGSVSDLEKIKEEVDLPVLRKDFILDPYQLYESRVYGADCVLLITKILGRNTEKFVNLAHRIGLETLVEVHTKEELKLALNTDTDLLGVNNRDLSSLQVNIETSRKLQKSIPEDRTVVSESGIFSREEINYLNADAYLIGTSIMRSDDIEKKVRSLTNKEEAMR